MCSIVNKDVYCSIFIQPKSARPCPRGSATAWRPACAPRRNRVAASVRAPSATCARQHRKLRTDRRARPTRRRAARIPEHLHQVVLCRDGAHVGVERHVLLLMQKSQHMQVALPRRLDTAARVSDAHVLVEPRERVYRTDTRRKHTRVGAPCVVILYVDARVATERVNPLECHDAVALSRVAQH